MDHDEMTTVSQAKTELFYDEITSTPKKKKRATPTNDRRFSDEQIKSLESIFKTETKLESRRKLQLARELGLQPRQVSIWFQNRRARWKSKQIEQDYKVLRANYDSLYAQFDSLKREKQALQIQLQELSDVVKNLDEGDSAYNRDAEMKEHESTPNTISDMRTHDNDVICEEHGKRMIESFRKVVVVEDDLVSWGECEAREMYQLASAEEWCSLSPGCLFDQSPGCTSNWWENE